MKSKSLLSIGIVALCLTGTAAAEAPKFASGMLVDAQGMTGRIDRARGTETIVPQGGVVWVFALRR